MEAIGAGANIIAFVVLGLKCAKTIHNTLSAVKDGPQTLQQVSNDILQLYWILEQLQSRAAIHDAALQGQVRLCVEYLGSLAKIVEDLQITPNERISGRFWKRLKTILSDKSLDTVHLQITRQATLLSLRLNVLSSNTVYELRDGSDQIRNSVDALDTLVQKQNQSQASQIATFESIIASSFNSHENTIQAGLSSIQQNIQARSSISESNTSFMLSLLQEIKDHIVITPSQHFTPVVSTTDNRGENSCKTPLEASNERSGDLRIDQDMIDSIDRLCGLIQEKEREIDNYAEDDDQANCIVEDLQTLLRVARKRHGPVQQAQSNLLMAEAGGDAEMLFDRGLCRFSRSFGHNQLFLNRKIPKKAKHFYTTALQQTRTYSKADIGIGTLSIMAHKRKRSCTEDDADNQHGSQRQRTDYNLTVTFLPDSRQNPTMIVASTFQQELFKGSISSFSRLMVNRVLPVGSLVFNLVKEGKLRQLKELLHSGEASLRDHDEYGASLLFYSTLQPEICRFLIDSGLDVDHVGGSAGIDELSEKNYIVCPLQLEVNDFERDSKELMDVNKCRRLLLEAGADSTLNMDPSSSSFVESATADGVLSSLQLALKPDSVGYFFDVNMFDEYGRSLFLQACSNCQGGYNKECFGLLLDRGANIFSRDDLGRSCLHICLDDLRGDVSPLLRNQELEAIKYLLEREADPFATDEMGRSVSEAAYDPHRELLFGQLLSSYSGDLWDRVLHSRGFEIAHFRSNYQRIAIYTDKYSRRDFEWLWQGIEAQCPYWDDSPWPPMKPGEMDRDSSETESLRILECENTSDSDDDVVAEEKTSTSEKDNHVESGEERCLCQCHNRYQESSYERSLVDEGIQRVHGDEASSFAFQLAELGLENPWK